MFASDPLRAFGEARRVLRRGGRLVFAVWGPAEENPWQMILDDALEAFGIERRVSQRAAGGMFSLADARLLRTLLAESDLPLRELERIELLWRYRDLDAYWSIEVDTGGERWKRLRALRPAAARAFRGRLERDLSEYRRDSGFVLPAVTLVVAADA
jgi:SAM-dependent methyltransferase